MTVEAKLVLATHLLVYVGVNVVLLLVAGTLWLWVTLFWSIGLAFHAFGVFVDDSSLASNSEHRSDD